ncbi:MAG: methylmalonyl-CoA mutase [Ignavibacteria bacterium]|nr:methylmalonyl-CoA mutase [Ignavibacteria bacterium]
MSGDAKASGVKLGEKADLGKDFAPVSFEEWKKVVEADLKGAEYDKKLLTKTYEGITLQPIYTRKDIENLSYVNTAPGNSSRRGAKSSGYAAKGWEINQEIVTGDAEEFNEALTSDLNRGQTSINIQLDTATKMGKDADYATPAEVGDKGLSISAIKSISRALKGIDLNKYPINVNAGFSALPFVTVLNAYLQKNNIPVSSLKGSIESDPLGFIAENGKLPVSFKSVIDEAALVTKWVIDNKICMKTTGVNVSVYNNAGASAVQELAFAMATAVLYLNELTERGISAKQAAQSIRFTFGIGTNYFMEIAKFRAAKILWSNILEAFGIEEDEREIEIHAKSSTYFQTELDPYVNMLRTTTQAFSAVVGGVDSMHTNPFDEVFNAPDTFSRRIARNTQIILKEETHLDRLIDPAGGSYFIEKLTDDVAVQSWKLFQQIEEKGGMFEALISGFIQGLVKETAESRKKDYSKRKSVLVGTNMYANMKEEKIPSRKTDPQAFFKKRSEYLQKFRVSGNQEKNSGILEKMQQLVNDNSADVINTATSAILEGATIGEISSAVRAAAEPGINISPLEIKRGSELFEELRNASDAFLAKTGKRPQIFMANMGPVKQFKARADFAQGFFETGGFEMLNNKGFKTPEEAVKAALDSNAPIVIICSTDDTYPELVPAIASGIKSANPSVQLVLAGFPKEQVEAHKASGIDEFIFLGADAYQILSGLMNKLK